MARTFFVLGSVLALLAVIGGAVGSHVLGARLTPDRLASFELANQYHMYHALGLLAAAWAATRWTHAGIAAGGWLLFAGVLLFSGSIYLLSMGGPRWLGPVTPFGGLTMIAGWAFLAYGVLRG